MDSKLVKFKDTIIAHIFYKDIGGEGVKFLTPSDYTLQLGLLTHKSGHVVRNHIHRTDIEYPVDTAQEFLFVQKGKIRMKLFSEKWDPLPDEILSEGDFILLVRGGHGLEVIEDCRIIEIKQGPYPGEKLAKIYQDEVSK